MSTDSQTSLYALSGNPTIFDCGNIQGRNPVTELWALIPALQDWAEADCGSTSKWEWSQIIFTSSGLA